MRRRQKETPPDVRSTVHDEDTRPVPVDEAEIPFVGRFNLATAGLFALAAIALIATALVVNANSGDNVKTVDETWSAWQPESKGPDRGALEIADHVGRDYRLPNGEQLVALTGGPMEIGGLPANIALRQSAADGGDINLLPGNGVLYRMCGLGPDCRLDKGKPSIARHLLLRREALELALYSFRYLKKDVENVIVMMPPPAKSAAEEAAERAQPATPEPAETTATQALYFQRDVIKRETARPLELTLPKPAPTPNTMRKSKNALLVDQLTTPLQFRASITQANQESSVFIVLDPLRTAPVLLGGRTGGNPADVQGTNGSLNTPLTKKPAPPPIPKAPDPK